MSLSSRKRKLSARRLSSGVDRPARLSSGVDRPAATVNTALDSFQELDSKDTTYENQVKLNANLKNINQLCVSVLRGLRGHQTEKAFDVERTKKQMGILIHDHHGAAFKTGASLQALFSTPQGEKRDFLWDNELEPSFKPIDAATTKQLKNYFLKRLHNRYSRLLPWLFVLLKTLGGK